MKRIFFLILLAASVTVQAETIVHLKKAGKLDAELTPEQIDTCTSLTIIGELNSEDIRLLRRMAGAPDASESKGKLRTLDLRKAEFRNDKTPYVVLDMAKERFSGSSLPVFNESPGDNLGYTIPTHGGGEGSKTVSLKNHVAYHRASYILSHSGSSDGTGTFVTENHNHLTVDFTKQPYEKDHRKLRSHNMLKVKGHKIKWENNRYVWYAYLRKGIFSYDMFYGCDQLQAIALPKGGKVLDCIKVDKDNKRYYSSE